MKLAITSLVCLSLATACAQDEAPITVLDHDARTNTATLLIDSTAVEIDLSRLPQPDPTEPKPELSCWWGDYSECGWEWEPETGGTVCCGW